MRADGLTPGFLGWAFCISSRVSKGIDKSVVQSCREFLNIGGDDGLSYRAALRWVMWRRFYNAWAAEGTRKRGASGLGVVRAMA